MALLLVTLTEGTDSSEASSIVRSTRSPVPIDPLAGPPSAGR